MIFVLGNEDYSLPFNRFLRSSNHKQLFLKKPYSLPMFDMEKVCIPLVRGGCVRQFLRKLAFTEWAAPMPWGLGDYTQVCNGVLEREL